jgi:hypothetical protein
MSQTQCPQNPKSPEADYYASFPIFPGMLYPAEVAMRFYKEPCGCGGVEFTITPAQGGATIVVRERTSVPEVCGQDHKLRVKMVK